ncbi:4-amino-4-deoxychorismate lyase [Candidatus Magnetomorum sp. HK-1]|nr:4-amino-4-deoxychorismate lyase [Candidatus Magnetomorum sp. HK-1]
MLFWNNHELIKISLPPFLSDTLQGKGVFETILVSENKTFLLWNDHINRLKKGIHFLGKQISIDFQKLHKSLINYFHTENYTGLFRLNLFYISESEGILIRIFPFQWPIKSARLYMNNKYFRGNSPHYQYKTLSRMEYVYFQQLAQENNCDDYLMTDSHQQVLETCLANIFFVRKDGVFETPVADNKPLLDGILRSYLINNQKSLGIKCIEKKITNNTIQDYSQAFITNGLRLVQPVSIIGKCCYTKDDIGWKLRDIIYSKLIDTESIL